METINIIFTAFNRKIFYEDISKNYNQIENQRVFILNMDGIIKIIFLFHLFINFIYNKLETHVNFLGLIKFTSKIFSNENRLPLFRYLNPSSNSSSPINQMSNPYH